MPFIYCAIFPDLYTESFLLTFYTIADIFEVSISEEWKTGFCNRRLGFSLIDNKIIYLLPVLSFFGIEESELLLTNTLLSVFCIVDLDLNALNFLYTLCILISLWYSLIFCAFSSSIFVCCGTFSVTLLFSVLVVVIFISSPVFIIPDKSVCCYVDK